MSKLIEKTENTKPFSLTAGGVLDSVPEKKANGRARGLLMANPSSATRLDEPSPIVFCDFDGTITQVDVTDAILERLADPQWRDLERAWVRGEIGSRERLARQMAVVPAPARAPASRVQSSP